MIKLGHRVKDVITGLEGVATGRCTYINGCIQILIRPQGLHEGKPIDGQWVDEQRIKVVEELEWDWLESKVSEPEKAGVGGPQNSSPSTSHG